MIDAPRKLSPTLLALLLAACGGSDNSPTGTSVDAASASVSDSSDLPESTSGAGDDTTTSADPTTTGEDATTAAPTTGEPVDPTTGGSSTGEVVDPCARCSPDASCRGETCVCDEGFAGDGESCEDVDECAGKNDCAVDATCTNTPGAYECACDEGYKGNGFTCKDVDECTEDLDMCSKNATCANQDGAYKCTCKDGFNGDGFVCNGSKKFGDACVAGEDCASGLCLGGDFDMCTVTCTQNVANDCGGQGVTGLCVPVGDDMFACAGDMTFGADKDDVILKAGDKVKRDFQSKTDADLFLIDIAVPGDYLVAATPDPDDDIQLEFYNGDATELGTLNMFGVGQAEGGVITVQGGVFFAVARNIGASNGSYTIEVVKQ